MHIFANGFHQSLNPVNTLIEIMKCSTCVLYDTNMSFLIYFLKKGEKKGLEKAFELVNNSLFAPGANEHVMNDFFVWIQHQQVCTAQNLFFITPETLNIESDLQTGAGSALSEGNSNGKKWLGVRTQQHDWLFTENDVL